VNLLIYIGTHPMALPTMLILVGILLELSRRNKQS
jgi:hypothetical protein